jgi:hypothetical protein
MRDSNSEPNQVCMGVGFAIDVTRGSPLSLLVSFVLQSASGTMQGTVLQVTNWKIKIGPLAWAAAQEQMKSHESLILKQLEYKEIFLFRRFSKIIEKN